SNTWRHLESWYGIAGMGGVYHTLNPRLFVDQLVYIANHAEDRALFFDPQFAPLVSAIAPRLETVRHYIAFADAPPAEFPDAIAFVAPMTGAKLVLPGPKLDGASVYELLDTEKITVTAAVPTVWLSLLQYLEASGKMLPHLERVLIGGSACPRKIIECFEQKY